MNETEKLNLARENLSKNLPLPEENWLEWLVDLQGDDVSQLTEEKAKYIIDLYQKALNDYQSKKKQNKFFFLLIIFSKN